MGPIITFDAGQVLIELDLDFLSVRLAERGAIVAAAALTEALPAAWVHHDACVRAGAQHPWRELMTALLTGAGAASAAAEIPRARDGAATAGRGADATEPRGDRGAFDVPALVDWLWAEQPRANLWRKPVPAMVALARELAAGGARVGVLSNSEGRLAELLADIGVADAFAAIVDSGRVGIAKPDARIFEHARAALGGAPGEVGIHIGDSWAADVDGARGAGWTPIWYAPDAHARDGVAAAREVDGVRAAIEHASRPAR